MFFGQVEVAIGGRLRLWQGTNELAELLELSFVTTRTLIQALIDETTRSPATRYLFVAMAVA